jgi:hypothetical protein
MTVSTNFKGLLSLGALGALGILSACSVPNCDAEQAQTLLRQAASNSASHATITNVSNIATTSHDSRNSVCTAHFATNRGFEYDARYHITMDGSRIRLQIDNAQPNVPPCDNATITSGLRTLISNRGGLTVSSMTNVATTSHSATGAVCTAHIAAANGAEADIGYTLTQSPTDINYVITAFTPTHAANDGSAAPTMQTEQPAAGDQSGAGNQADGGQQPNAEAPPQE